MYYLHSSAAKDHANQFVTALDLGEGLGTLYGAAWSDQLQAAAQQARDYVRGVIQSIGANEQSFPELKIEVQNSGKWFRAYIGDALVGSFRSYEEALKAATLEGIKQMDLSGVAPEIQAAIQAGTITSVDQLQAVADIFQQLSASANPVAEQLRQIDIQTEAWTRTLQEAGVATTRVTEWQASQAQSIRDQITGTTKTQKQIFDEQSRQFNTWLEQEHAKAQAAYDTANAEHAAAEAEIVRLQALIASAQASGAAAQFLEKWTEQLAAAQQQLADSAAALAQAQGTLAGLPDPIAPNEFKSGGRGTRQSDMQQVRDLIDQMKFDRLAAGMSELDAGLAKLNRDYQDQLVKAHGNAELVAALTAEYAAQEEQLRLNIQLSAVDKFQQALGIGQDPFSQLEQQFDDARKAVEEAGFGADRAAKMLGRLDAALQHQIEVLSQQQFVAIGDGLVGILEKYYGGVEGFEQFRMQLEQVRFMLEVANLRAQFEILKAQGTLSDAVIAKMQGVFDFIDAHPIDWAAFVAPAAPAITRANRAASSINDTFAEMARRLATAKESITSFLLSLQTGAFGGRSSSEAFNAAKSQFGALLNQAQVREHPGDRTVPGNRETVPGHRAPAVWQHGRVPEDPCAGRELRHRPAGGQSSHAGQRGLRSALL